MIRKAVSPVTPAQPIAVIGVGCRFPGGADSPEALWRLLLEGRDGLREVPAERWAIDAWHDDDRDAPGKMNMRRAGFLARGIAGFDAAFFGVAPREAVAMDPQQRLLLEVAWETLEDAACAPESLAGTRCGVFVGLYNNNYGMSLRASPAPQAINGWTASGAHPSIAAGRLSYSLDLSGPSLVIDTACSSSLVAVHLAVRSLQSGECDSALAGGVHLMLSPESLVASTKLGATAPDGRCKAFDASADGFGHGEGCGVVMLKRLDDALAAGDRVMAVIRGTCVNQDGRSNSLTAPSGPAQEALVRAALDHAGIEPRLVGYVEAHGTGTPLGDPIEIEALAGALANDRDTPLVVGSVKGNLGHLEAAAGIAGFIKAALCVERGVIPAHLHFSHLNPDIDVGDFPLRIPVERERWEGIEGRRIAGVSAFGFSGTNAHIVLEAPPHIGRDEAPLANAPQVLALSARSASALQHLAGHWAEWLEHAMPSAADAAFTAGAGRGHHRHRMAVVGDDARGLATALRLGAGEAHERPPRVAFLFTGQGSQYAGMGARAYETQPAFRAALDRHARLLDRLLGKPALALLFGERDIDDTDLAQPLVVAIELALAALWRSWGVEPAAVMGHSVGEFAAAAVAGVLSEEAVLELVAERGRLMKALPAGGGMLVISASAGRIEPLLRDAGGSLAIAALNGAGNTVVSGDVAGLERLASQLRAQGLRCAQLAVSHAFHSPLIEPMLPALERAAQLHAGCAPRIPVVSNLTGKPERQFDAAYWRDHARQPVRFFAGLESLVDLGCDVFLEIGPQAVLSGMGAASQPERRFIPSLRRGTPDDASLAQGLAALYRAGAPIRWDAVHAGSARRKLSAPTYPFERDEYWLALPSAPHFATTPVAVPAAAGATGNAVVYDFYDELTVISGDEDEGNLSFGFLPAPQPGFSWIRALFERDESSPTRTLFRSSQRELKDALFAGIDFSRMKRVLDYGCGHAADLCRLGTMHAHLDLTGFTISARQVEVGNRRAQRLGLAPRVHLHRNDSSAVAFPGTFDLVFGIEVTGLIANKEGLFDNIAAHLAPGGLLVIADFVSTADAIVNPETNSFTPSVAQWVELLSTRKLRLVRAIDASEDVADWLVDPAFDANIDELVRHFALGALTRRHLLSNENIGKALRVAIMRYLLLTAQHSPHETVDELRRANEALLRATPRYRDAVRATGRWRDWLHQIEWAREEPVTAPPSNATIASALASSVARERDALDRFGAVGRELDRISRAYVVEAFAALGNAPVIAPMRRLHEHLARTLAAAGTQPSTENADALCDRTLAAHPEAHAELTLLRRCGPRLAEALTGRVAPLDLLFPGGDATLAEALYERSPFSQAVQRLAAEVLDALPRAQSLHVIEIGAGTGATTAHVLAHLPAGSRYLYTDVAPTLLERAREKFAGRALAFAPLDVSIPAAAQNIATGAFDVAIAANVLHATPRLAQSLAHVREMLVPGGLLLLVENTGRLAWGDLTFGLTPGMWNFADERLRDHALITQAQWRRVLAESGFEDVEILTPGEPDRGGVSQQCVILARRSARRHWLLSHDDAALAAELRARGDECTVAQDESIPAGVTDVACLTSDPQAALGLVKAVASKAEAPRLAFVSRGAYAVQERDAAILDHAALPGFARSVAGEVPEARVRLVDIDATTQPKAVADELRHGNESEIALRASGRHRPALKHARSAGVAHVRLDPSASYIVTGAFGGIGLVLLPWLARHGAKTLVLGVRGEPSAHAHDVMRELRDQGIDVRVPRCDVAHADQVAALVSAAQEAAPLRGVFHAAGVVADAALAHQDTSHFEKVFAAKVHGTRNLHEATAKIALDHFVLFSSAAALLGPSGQANHAAANEFVGAFAQWRRGQGLPAVAIEWGAWAEVGAAARDGIDARVERSGLIAMSPDDALEALAHAMTLDRPRVAVVAAHWPKYLERFPAGGAPTLLRGLAARLPARESARPERAKATIGLRETLAQALPLQREDILREAIRGHAARVMALPDARAIDDERALRDLGLDSLMSIELRNALVAACGTKLPATLLFDHPSVALLAQELARSAFAEWFEEATKKPADALAAMDARELSALLEAELREAGAGGSL